MKQFTKGSTGMIALLIGVALPVALYAYYFFGPRPEMNVEERQVQPMTASGTLPTTEYERSRADVNAAKAAQELPNAHNKDTNAALGE